MLERRDHDRVPRSDGYWPDTIRRWQGEGLDGDGATVLAMLGNDVQGLCWSWPVPFPGQYEVIAEDEQTRTFRDSMGKIERQWKDRSGTPEHVAFDCDSAAKWFDRYRPALLSQPPSPKTSDDPGTADAGGRFRVLRGIEAFEGMRQLVGDEVLLMAMAAEPEWVRDMARTYTDLILRDWQAVLDAGRPADAIWPYGDMGYNHGPFFSPAMYRELIQPEHRRMGQWASERGLKYIYHTDGDIRPLIDGLLDAGIHCLQPMEAKANVDVRELAPQYGDRLSFFGNIDARVMETNDPERVEAEITEKFAAGMARRGYAYHSDHSVPPSVSWSTYQHVIAMVDRYGWYG
jgi:uroporphyrinogen decarboxylase